MKLLLAIMLVTALIATGAHYCLLYVAWLNQQIPAYLQQIYLSEAIMFSILLAAWIYFFVRTPFLARDAVDFRRRWNMLRKHRQDLEAWSNEYRTHIEQQPDGPGSPTPES